MKPSKRQPTSTAVHVQGFAPLGLYLEGLPESNVSDDWGNPAHAHEALGRSFFCRAS